MNNIYIFLLLGLLTIPYFSLEAQADLLGELESRTEEVKFNYPAFKAMKIANLQSTKVAAKGDLYMYVSHRFGTVKDGVSTFFGLDNASTKIELVYGVSKGLQLGISRESFRKTYAGSLKLRLFEQGQYLPFNAVLFTTLNVNTEINNLRYPDLNYFDRHSYATQLLISRRVNNYLSLLIAPSYIRQNFVWEVGQKANQFALGLGGRFKVTKRMSINADYAIHLSRVEDSVYNNLLSIDIDLETGGHVFQLLFSNSQSTNEPSFISNASGDWSTRDIFFGFNVVRVF